MANVLSITESLNDTGTVGENNQFTIAINFQVIFDAIAFSQEALVATDGSTTIPENGERHPDTSLIDCFCVSIDANKTSSRKIWNITANYQTKIDNESLPNNDPTEEFPDIAWSFVNRSVIIVKDVDGKAIGPSSGEVYDPPLTEDSPLLQLTMTRNERARDFKPKDARSFINSVNEKALSIFGFQAAERQAKLVELSAKSALFEGVQYWVVSYRILLEEDGKTWDREVLDQGFKVLNADGVAIYAKNKVSGDQEEKPIKLDGSGKRLADGADDVFNTFRTLREIKFSLLGIPR